MNRDEGDSPLPDMGNEIYTTINKPDLDRVNPVDLDKGVKASCRPGGIYREYRSKKLEMEVVCANPDLRYSPELRKHCVDLQIEYLTVKAEAYNETHGYAGVMDEHLS